MRRLFVAAVLLLCVSVMGTNAAGPVLDMYNQPLLKDVGRNQDVVDYIKSEVIRQSRAMAPLYGIDADEAEGLVDLDRAVKTVFIGSEGILDDLDSARDITLERHFVASHDMFKVEFLDFVWEVPVSEIKDSYLYASVRIDRPRISDAPDYQPKMVFTAEDVTVWFTATGDKTTSSARYYFDRELIGKIIKKSGLEADYDTILPVTLSTLFGTDIILFFAEDALYAIPFSSRPDFLGLENGKVYEYETVRSSVSALLEEMSGGYIGGQSGGGGGALITKPEPVKKAAPYWLYAMGTAAVIGAGVAVYRKRRA